VTDRLTSRDQKQDGVGQESNSLHPLSSVELVVNQESGKVVSTKRDTDVDQVPQPTSHNVVASTGGNDLDETGSE
jgi:hypothetical protein